MTFQVLDNTINKVAEEVLSPEELEERQLKIQVIWKKNLQLLLLQLSFILDLLINKFWWTEYIFLIAFSPLSKKIIYFTSVEVNNGGYLPCHSVAQLISTTIHQHWSEHIFFKKPKRVVYFCQYYNEKGLKVDFVSLPAWQWIILADCFSTNESAHMKCTIHLCCIFWKMIFVDVRFFVNFVNSVYQYYFFMSFHFGL